MIFSLLPLRFLGWAGWVGSLADVLVTPVRHPLAAVSRWLSPERPRQSDEAVRVLEDELERTRVSFLQTQTENERLRGIILELQRGAALNADRPVTQLAAGVTGVSSDLASDLLSVRAGRRQGVTRGSVAAAPGLQLLGRVVEVGARTCLIQPITSKASGLLRARVMLDEGGGVGLACLLTPFGDGTLRGPVEDVGGVEPAAGQNVRLADSERWPTEAQMLLVGRVERVDPDPNQPLRRVVTVRPTVRLDRVGEVVLRLTPADENENGAAPGSVSEKGTPSEGARKRGAS